MTPILQSSRKAWPQARCIAPVLAGLLVAAAAQAGLAETPARPGPAAEAAPPAPVRSETDLSLPAQWTPQLLPASPQPRADESLTRPKHLPLPRARKRAVERMA